MDDSYTLHAQVPETEDYLRLRQVAGLSAKSSEAARAGLPNTLFAVIVRKESRVVGMGRLIGDGGLFYQIVDVAVEPEHQGHGLGKAIMASLTEHVRATAPTSAYVSLLADGDARHLYHLFGFRETAPVSVGMAFRVA